MEDPGPLLPGDLQRDVTYGKRCSRSGIHQDFPVPSPWAWDPHTWQTGHEVWKY